MTAGSETLAKMDDAITGMRAAAERRAATDRRAFGWRTVFFGFLRLGGAWRLREVRITP